MKPRTKSAAQLATDNKLWDSFLQMGGSWIQLPRENLINNDDDAYNDNKAGRLRSNVMLQMLIGLLNHNW